MAVGRDDCRARIGNLVEIFCGGQGAGVALVPQLRGETRRVPFDGITNMAEEINRAREAVRKQSDLAASTQGWGHLVGVHRPRTFATWIAELHASTLGDPAPRARWPDNVERPGRCCHEGAPPGASGCGSTGGRSSGVSLRSDLSHRPSCPKARRAMPLQRPGLPPLPAVDPSPCPIGPAAEATLPIGPGVRVPYSPPPPLGRSCLSVGVTRPSCSPAPAPPCAVVD